MHSDNHTQIRKMMGEFYKSEFNELALKYENDEDIAGWSDHSLNRQIAAFLSVFLKLKIDKGGKILDVGCGPGTYSIILADNGNNVTGIDFAEHMVRKAAMKSVGKNIQYTIADAYSLPFKDRSFDMAICTGVLQHVTDEKRVINEMKRVLKEDQGVMMLITMNSCSIKVFLRKLRGKFISVFSRKRYRPNNMRLLCDLIYRNPFDVKKTVEDSGLGEVEVKGVYIFPAMLRRLETVFEKTGVFRIINRIPFMLLIMSHMFIIKAVKIKKNQNKK